MQYSQIINAYFNSAIKLINKLDSVIHIKTHKHNKTIHMCVWGRDNLLILFSFNLENYSTISQISLYRLKLNLSEIQNNDNENN